MLLNSKAAVKLNLTLRSLYQKKYYYRPIVSCASLRNFSSSTDDTSGQAESEPLPQPPPMLEFEAPKDDSYQDF